MTIATELASRIHGLTYDALAEAAVHWAQQRRAGSRSTKDASVAVGSWLEAKFLDCAQRSVTRPAAEHALQLLRRFDEITCAAALTALLAAGCLTEPAR